MNKFAEVEMTDAERLNVYARWALTETKHLRQLRTLKASSLIRHKMRGVSIAGYQTVRVLGKGSFGVVRLVTEKRVSQGVEGNMNTATGERRNGHGENHQHAELNRLDPQEVYAMKVIRKSDMLRSCQEAHLRAERDFLVASEGSQWTVPLIAAFQDNTNLYLVMEYMPGGDFLGLLLREDVLDEQVAKWYVAEMILCIEEAHKMNWIHRDIKPDNFLVSSSGHLKISDFGLAFDGHWAHNQSYFSEQRSELMEILGLTVQGDTEDMEEDARTSTCGVSRTPRSGKRRVDAGERPKVEGLLNWRNRTEKRKLARSIVGTSQYMAPEVILGQPYDGRCDWWSIGVILYEASPCCVSRPLHH